jgi:hypothetical protein
MNGTKCLWSLVAMMLCTCFFGKSTAWLGIVNSAIAWDFSCPPLTGFPGFEHLWQCALVLVNGA